ncbi:hypothetical protein GZL_04038 [Streptomyces sp. 769]|nr:hypothetical protein GZL_04038 [Streptomyces sp. 769]
MVALRTSPYVDGHDRRYTEARSSADRERSIAHTNTRSFDHERSATGRPTIARLADDASHPMP